MLVVFGHGRLRGDKSAASSRGSCPITRSHGDIHRDFIGVHRETRWHWHGPSGLGTTQADNSADLEKICRPELRLCNGGGQHGVGLGGLEGERGLRQRVGGLIGRQRGVLRVDERSAAEGERDEEED